MGVVERGGVGEACGGGEAEEEREECVGAGAVGGVLEDEVGGEVVAAELAAELLGDAPGGGTRGHGVGGGEEVVDVGVVLEGGEAEAARGDDEGDAGVGLLDGRVDGRAVDAAAERHLVLQDEDGAGGSLRAGAGEAEEVVEEPEEDGLHARSGYMVGACLWRQCGGHSRSLRSGSRMRAKNRQRQGQRRFCTAKSEEVMSEEVEQATARATAVLYS